MQKTTTVKKPVKRKTVSTTRPSVRKRLTPSKRKRKKKSIFNW